MSTGLRVIIVNGRPGVGKTTFEEYCKDVLGVGYVNSRSSIDKVKEIVADVEVVQPQFAGTQIFSFSPNQPRHTPCVLRQALTLLGPRLRRGPAVGCFAGTPGSVRY